MARKPRPIADDDQRLGAKIRRARDAKGLTQQQLADLIGCHRTFISFIERGTKRPQNDITWKLARELNLRAEDLIPGDLISLGEAEALELFRKIPEQFRQEALDQLRLVHRLSVTRNAQG